MKKGQLSIYPSILPSIHSVNKVSIFVPKTPVWQIRVESRNGTLSTHLYPLYEFERTP